MFYFQTSEDEFRPPLKKRKVGRPRKNPNPFDEGIKKHLAQTPKKEKQQGSLSLDLLSTVSTIKINNIETPSSGQYKIKPKLKAEVKVSYYYVTSTINFEFLILKCYLGSISMKYMIV